MVAIYVAIHHHKSFVAAAEPTERERFLVSIIILEIAQHNVVPANYDLTTLARRNRLAMLVMNRHLILRNCNADAWITILLHPLLVLVGG
ncbi:MAG: hypothetical protein DYG96_08155 [Chlorobi bacterium CHB2]|nr:hypothetical protein [Chlorobi bacterium CHB2]